MAFASRRLATYACLLLAMLAGCRDASKLPVPKWTSSAKSQLEAFARDRCAEVGEAGQDRATCKEPRAEYEVDADGEHVRSLKLQIATIDADATTRLLDEALRGLASEDILGGIHARLTKSPKATDHFSIQNADVDVSSWKDDPGSALRFQHTTVEIRWH